MFKTILNEIELIENNKNTILDKWMGYDAVEYTLIGHGFKVDYYRDKFALKVLEYAIGVVKSNNELGNCPVIGVMLIIFKKKNIPLSDVFTICVHFKNALMHFMLENSKLSNEMLTEVCMLVDYNFEGVIIEYIDLYYHDSEKYKPSNSMTKAINSDNLICEIDTTADTVSSKPSVASSKTSAEAYLSEIELDMEMLAELNELEADALDAIHDEEVITHNSLIESAHLFEQYSKILNTTYEFEELSFTLIILKDLLLSTKFETIDEETKYMVTIYLKAIISDLQSWRMSIFETQEADDIHYLDKTLMSSIAQLEITLMPKEYAEDDEIEFF